MFRIARIVIQHLFDRYVTSIVPIYMYWKIGKFVCFRWLMAFDLFEFMIGLYMLSSFVFEFNLGWNFRWNIWEILIQNDAHILCIFNSFYQLKINNEWVAIWYSCLNFLQPALYRMINTLDLNLVISFKVKLTSQNKHIILIRLKSSTH